jgi:hypothetical protein
MAYLRVFCYKLKSDGLEASDRIADSRVQSPTEYMHSRSLLVFPQTFRLFVSEVNKWVPKIKIWLVIFL